MRQQYAAAPKERDDGVSRFELGREISHDNVQANLVISSHPFTLMRTFIMCSRATGWSQTRQRSLGSCLFTASILLSHSIGKSLGVNSANLMCFQPFAVDPLQFVTLFLSQNEHIAACRDVQLCPGRLEPLGHVGSEKLYL